MVKEVIIYSTPTCPYCTKMKDWLNFHKVSFNEINVAQNPDAAEKMMEESSQVGVPVLKITENSKIKRIIVGYDTDELEDEFT